MVCYRDKPFFGDALNVDRTNIAEEWRPVVGFESAYEVSSLGRIRGFIGSQGRVRKIPRLLHPRVSKSGYPIVTIKRLDYKKSRSVHSLVARAFLGPRPEGHQVNHIDLNRQNAALSNLEYLTCGDNLRHSYRAGTMTRKGEANSCAKIDENSVAAIVLMSKAGANQFQIADKFKIHQSTVSDVLSGRTWAHVTGRKYERVHG